MAEIEVSDGPPICPKCHGTLVRILQPISETTIRYLCYECGHIWEIVADPPR